MYVRWTDLRKRRNGACTAPCNQCILVLQKWVAHGCWLCVNSTRDHASACGLECAPVALNFWDTTLFFQWKLLIGHSLLCKIPKVIVLLFSPLSLLYFNKHLILTKCQVLPEAQATHQRTTRLRSEMEKIQVLFTTMTKYQTGRNWKEKDFTLAYISRAQSPLGKFMVLRAWWPGTLALLLGSREMTGSGTRL